jgi:hypothetical protein
MNKGVKNQIGHIARFGSSHVYLRGQETAPQRGQQKGLLVSPSPLMTGARELLVLILWLCIVCFVVINTKPIG